MDDGWTVISSKRSSRQRRVHVEPECKPAPSPPQVVRTVKRHSSEFIHNLSSVEEYPPLLSKPSNASLSSAKPAEGKNSSDDAAGGEAHERLSVASSNDNKSLYLEHFADKRAVSGQH